LKIGWGEINDEDRLFVRKKFGNFNNILDIGCGSCPEYFGIKQMYKNVKYTGMDITQKLVKYNQDRGINCILGSLNNIPFKDSTFDIIHSRHVVEHMNNIETPLNEMIRVCKNKIFISFFIKPNESKNHKLNLSNKNTSREIYHNSYSKYLIEKQLNMHQKVKKFEWFPLNKHSVCLLVIYILIFL